MSRHIDHKPGSLMDHFHRDRQAGLHDSAEAHLERALHTPEYRSEALIWKAIEALQQNKPQSAFVHLSNAATALPDRTDVLALVARSIQLQRQPQLAHRYIKTVWRDAPLDLTLRMALWNSRSQCETPDQLRQSILKHLPEVDDPRELKLLLGLLSAQAAAPETIGVVYHDAEQGMLTGWALNLHAPDAIVHLTMLCDGTEHPVLADAPCPLLTGMGLPDTHGAICVTVAPGAQALHLRTTNGSHLLGSPISILPAFKPPSSVLDNDATQQPVDVLVPVYEGLEETLECLHSVLHHRHHNRTEHRLVVLDDATPNAALREALEAMAQAGNIHYVRQPTNLGFIRNTNRGMALSPNRDVVWLNADTRVHGNWLDRLREAAYQTDDIASVTPFTNNGELMSFPASRISHDMPSAEVQAEIDQLAAQISEGAVEIETGCGFCLYIKRSALDNVGYLDEVQLLRGYGEETDWCLRARSLGWRHMGAPNIFVAHQGGISFGDEKPLRVAHNNAILRRRYPDAEARYKTFCLRDPLRPTRQALQHARLKHLGTWMTEATERSYLILTANRSHPAPLSLSWHNQAKGCVATLKAQFPPMPLSVDYALPMDSIQLLTDLKSLPISGLTYEHLTNCPMPLLALAEQLQQPYRIHCHDDVMLRDRQRWLEFARHATAIELPWASLSEAYAIALPGSALQVPTARTALPKARSKPEVLLIADDLRDAKVAQRWMGLARLLKRKKSPLRLLILEDSPWLAQLQATGVVLPLPVLPGLSQVESLSLAGCQSALSLDLAPGSAWPAAHQAAQNNLTLYAEKSSPASEAGALPINHLPMPRSWAMHV